MKVKKIIIIVLCVLLVTMLNIFNALKINPTQLTIREETLKSNKIDSSFDGLFIAYFSDLNYGGVIEENELANLVDTINAANPDIVLFGGDLLYATSVDTDYIVDELSSIKSRIGKYAVLGEEDDTLSEDILIESGFEILDSENIQIYTKSGSSINLVGIGSNGNASDAIAGLSDAYTICLCHYPDSATNVTGADYILAGHSLGGRVYIPLISTFLRPNGASKYYRSKHSVNGATLDITNGVGTKEKSARFLADAEVVFYKLEAN